MNKMLKLSCIPFYFIILQACSSPQTEEKGNPTLVNSSDSIMPKEFGDRFSTAKIKQKREAFFAQKRQQLKRKNPIHEANKSIQNNNVYLMAIPAGRGTSQSFPGIPESQVQQIKCNIQLVEGQGDVLYGKNHYAYRQELQIYMQQFNTVMLPFCKA